MSTLNTQNTQDAQDTQWALYARAGASTDQVHSEDIGMYDNGEWTQATHPRQDDFWSDYQMEDLAGASAKICYGMLHGISAEVRWLANEVEQETIQSSVGNFLPLSIVFQDKYARLQTSDGFPTAVLNNKAHQGLLQINRETTAHVQAFVLYTAWVEANNKFRGSEGKKNDPVCFQTNVILSGPHHEGSFIAKSLANLNLYLQEPLPGAACYAYDNPQSLHIPHIWFTTNQQHDVQELDLLLIDDSEQEADLDPTAEDMSSLLVDIEAFLNKMPVHTYVQSYQDDQRILTSLLPHQREGVDFINRRELGNLPPELNLWKLQLSANDDQYYQHVITGAKSLSKVDCRGGILADDMGLGKTLTVLTTVLLSLDRAREFAMLGGNRSAKSTIIIVPSECKFDSRRCYQPYILTQAYLVLLNTWENEIKKHIIYGAISHVKYHGSERHGYESRLSDFDLILTTYGTAMVEFRKRKAGLFGKTWYRLVLDEAHSIRNSASKQFESVGNISSHIRWCLTGTPIQNSLDDLGSLVRYLKVPVFEDGAAFRKHISKLRQSAQNTHGEFENLKLLLSSICLRRTKSILPGLGHITADVRPEFSRQERQQYSGLEIACKRAITLAIGNKNKDGTHHGVMQALLRLRMFCNNGFYQTPAASAAVGSHDRPDEALSLLQQSGQAMCSYCSCDVVSISSHMDSDAAYLTQCVRLVCHDCIAQYRSEIEAEGVATCPLCNTQHQTDGKIYAEEGVMSQLSYPSKIRELVKDVQGHYMRDKCVIFTFWKTTLDIVERALVDKRLNVLRIDGNVTPRRRNTVLTDFQSRSTFRILLMTFSTGAVGLNGLTVASRVHILEPQWNPAVENQAIGRLLRINQAERVTVIRYVMRRSIEESVQSKQHRKLQLAGGGFPSGGSKAEQIHQLESLMNFSTRAGE